MSRRVSVSKAQRAKNKKLRLKGIESRRRKPRAEAPIKKLAVGFGRHYFDLEQRALLSDGPDAVWFIRHVDGQERAMQYRKLNGAWVEWGDVLTLCDCATRKDVPTLEDE